MLTAAPDAIPLVLAATASGAEVLDFAITAENAAKPGGLSIAVLVDRATVTFARCDLLAQAAKDGEAGVSGGAQEMQADPGLKGDDAGTTGGLAGGSGGSNTTCSLLGGNGGAGGRIPSGDGVDGTAGDANQGGAKGTGQPATMACANGANGDPAGLVTPGIGVIDTSGYHGLPLCRFIPAHYPLHEPPSSGIARQPPRWRRDHRSASG